MTNRELIDFLEKHENEDLEVILLGEYGDETKCELRDINYVESLYYSCMQLYIKQSK